jgi:serine/threonine protein kinase
VKITDFGLARWTDDDADGPGSHLTQLGTVLGTPDFISPEQARNSRTCDTRSDLYSLGCTFYFLLAGRPPFPTGNLTDKLMQHQLDQPEPVGKARAARLRALSPDDGAQAQSEVPAAIAAIIAKLLAKQPDERFQSPAELIEALTRVQHRLTHGTLHLPPPSQPETLVDFEITPPRPASRRVRVTPPTKKARSRAPTPTVAVSRRCRPTRPRCLWPWLLAAGLTVASLLGSAAGLALWLAWPSISARAQPSAQERDALSDRRAP